MSHTICARTVAVDSLGNLSGETLHEQTEQTEQSLHVLLTALVRAVAAVAISRTVTLQWPLPLPNCSVWISEPYSLRAFRFAESSKFY